ncbi:hypothetical protein HHI36_007985 [Cryptolaemus montrouzieri]|uniref:Dynactin subunit 2 n=1 Tax=Cryptolaemus montrouzieri TaxID=559131 RepID=A0ABD2MRE5_9CUCU
MADPKYADLPGIAHDEPDVYETNDLPESDQAADFYEKESEIVEKIHITPDEAFNQFKGKYLNQRNIDFSDRISSSIRTGYDAISGSWELAGLGQKETPLQRFNRLQCEFNELLEDVTKIQANKNGKIDCAITTEQIQDSLKKLTALQLEETLGSDVLSNMNYPQSHLLKQLESQLEQFKTISKEQPESQSQSDESTVVYQLNYRPELVKFQQTSRISELELRIHHLESVLGASNEKLSRLAAGSSKGSLLETSQHLASVANLLDSSQLDHIEGRLAALSQKLESIAEKKREIALDDDKNRMILELYELVKNTENFSELLPQTIQRLKSLEGLHNRATDLMKTLTEVETVQAEVSSNVMNNKILLQGVQESFANNLNEINQTIEGLDSRIKALKAKKDKK